MSNRNYCGPNRFPQNHRANNNPTIEQDRYRLPAINNGTTMTRPCIPQGNNNFSTQLSNANNTNYNMSNTNNPSLPTNSTSSNNNHKINCPPHGVAPSQTFSSTPITSGMYNTMQQVPADRSRSSNRFTGFDKTNTTNTDVNKNPIINQNDNSSRQRPITSGPDGFNYSSSNMNTSNGQKTVVRDRHLANEILQKAGITSNLTSNDCLEVITDVPITINDNVNCDPNPLCMKKPAESQVINFSLEFFLLFILLLRNVMNNQLLFDIYNRNYFFFYFYYFY